MEKNNGGHLMQKVMKYYIVHVIISTWINKTAYEFAKQGYVHYHELVRRDNGE